jgi:membrane protease YdiL (CAAX protease family)
MKFKMVKTENSIRILLGILFLVTAFHLCLIVKLIPYSIAWGGRLKSDTEMYLFEAISIFINLFLIALLLIKGNYLKFRVNEKVIHSILWIFFILFILNTIGNILAKTNFEKMFSILTLILALFILNILTKTNEQLQ